MSVTSRFFLLIFCLLPRKKDAEIISKNGNIIRGQIVGTTPHFRKYKEGTPHMIKSLSLVPMQPLDESGMKHIFHKLLGG